MRELRSTKCGSYGQQVRWQGCHCSYACVVGVARVLVLWVRLQRTGLGSELAALQRCVRGSGVACSDSCCIRAGWYVWAVDHAFGWRCARGMSVCAQDWQLSRLVQLMRSANSGDSNRNPHRNGEHCDGGTLGAHVVKMRFCAASSVCMHCCSAVLKSARHAAKVLGLCASGDKNQHALTCSDD
jgi:hypothetical protein